MGDRAYLLTAAGALALPALLALAVFPTPMIDTRELYAWGEALPLSTPKHPPMMALVGGLVERLLGASAFAAIFVGQILNAAGVLYLYGLLQMVVDRDRAVFFAFLFATSVYFQAGPLSWALNADILQAPIWLAAVFHFLRAAESNLLRHWLLVAVWAAAAVMTKYAAGLLLLAGFAATLIVPAFRGVWRNPRLYAALLLGVALLAPHALALASDSPALAAARDTLGGADLVDRVSGFGAFAGGTLLFMLPGWALVLVALRGGDLRIVAPRKEAVRSFLFVLALGLVVVTALVIGVLGVRFMSRYPAPFFGFFVLALAPFLRIEPGRHDRLRSRAVRVVAGLSVTLFLGAVLVWGVLTGHAYMQEPAWEGRAAVMAAWGERYACGPAYFLGDGSAYAFALGDGGEPFGIRTVDLADTPWFDPEQIRREGAIVVYRGAARIEVVRAALAGVEAGEPVALTLPLLRTLSGRTITWEYFFIAPDPGC